MQIQSESLYTLISLDEKGFTEKIEAEAHKNYILHFTQSFELSATDILQISSLKDAVNARNGIIVCTGHVAPEDCINVPTLHEAVEYVIMHELENDLLGNN